MLSDCISDHWNTIICLSLNMIDTKIYCLEQIKDEISVILEVDPTIFLCFFFLSFLMFILVFIKFKK